MTQDQIIELANQVGASKEWVISYSTTADWVFEDEQLQRFAELVRNEVLEEAALKSVATLPFHPDLGEVCAKQIRKLKS